MKKQILKIAVPTLALGLVFAPVASAASTETTVKTTASAKVAVQLTAKEREGIKRLTSITRNVSKVEARVTQLSKVTSDFYAKTAAVSSRTEVDFYKSISGKLKANTNELRSLKKQTDEIVRKFGKTDAAVTVYGKITAQNQAITFASKKIADLHTQFQTKAKEKEASMRLASINKNISKVEASVAQLSKVTTDFYAKVAAGTVSAKAETDFFASVSGKLKANTNQLRSLKKELDLYTKKYGKTEAVTAAYTKISAQNDAIAVNSKKLTDLHTQFQSLTKEKEASKRLAAISENVSKVEARVSAISKASTEFYAKAGAASVTANEEAEFYKLVSGQLKASSYQLVSLKKELDEAVKKYSRTEAAVALEAKITAQNEAIALTSKNLVELHTNFKPAVTTNN
ncbi:hypothetical protein RCG23_00685 [Neobacillus sp. PS3-34]|uniref:hypothetical protein n=1 Tax=Neobacillus sp. PS3-34 TaxID=3070678 RepID=UPI0027E180AB|nr:hypothetical protein [Neobacillus sp. PS3-34]WML48701.1 hypothetical protein RCG23_00685 [Neobacillus sp. PS3-34]